MTVPRLRRLCLVTWLAVSGLVMAEQTDLEPGSREAISRGYDLNRFKWNSNSKNSEARTANERTAARKTRIADPAIVRVQHSEPSEPAPLPDHFEMAQSDFLDDILNEKDLEIPAEEPPVPEATGETTTPKSPAALDQGRSTAPRRRSAGESFRPETLPNRSTPSPALTTPNRSSATSAPDAPPTPSPYRSSMMNQPYTLGGLLDDEDKELECLCEQEFCQAMWACAGGRCLSWCQRWARDLERNRDVLWLGSCGPRNYMNNPMRNWQCSYRQTQQWHGGWAGVYPGAHYGYGDYGGMTPSYHAGWQGGWQMPYGQSGEQVFPDMEGEPIPMEAGTIPRGN